MRRRRFSSSVLALCLLVCGGLALDCDWDRSVGQTLDLSLLAAGDLRSTDVSDPESCRAACCSRPDCDAAMVGFPEDGGPQCLLVRCLTPGRDACELQPSPQFNVSRKKVKTETQEEAKDGGEKLHVSPLLLGSWESRNNENSDILCRLPMKVGSCRAALTRFFYNVTSQSCQRFIYGGCEANRNNFNSQDECEALCSGVTDVSEESTHATSQLPVKAARMAPPLRTNVSQAAEGRVESTPAASERVQSQETEMSADDFAELCGAKPQVGPCRAAFQRWYYNTETGSCQSFIYGGCKGNKNNYASKEGCMAACTVTVLPSSKKVSSDGELSAEYKDQCMLTPDPGPCRAAFPMFYHDPNTGTCQSFIYGGCRGNQNRYNSLEECMIHCNKDGSSDSYGRARNRWTAAVFLFVTLAVISILLLVALIVMVMRRRTLSRSPSSISDKEELLPDEQSSVESLNITESPKPDEA